MPPTVACARHGTDAAPPSGRGSPAADVACTPLSECLACREPRGQEVPVRLSSAGYPSYATEGDWQWQTSIHDLRCRS